MKPPRTEDGVVPCTVAPNSWFPDPGDNGTAAIAKHLCRTRCRIVEACAEYGIRHERSGIWGGLSPAERAAIRARRHIPLTTPPTLMGYPRWSA